MYKIQENCVFSWMHGLHRISLRAISLILLKNIPLMSQPCQHEWLGGITLFCRYTTMPNFVHFQEKSRQFIFYIFFAQSDISLPGKKQCSYYQLKLMHAGFHTTSFTRSYELFSLPSYIYIYIYTAYKEENEWIKIQSTNLSFLFL